MRRILELRAKYPHVGLVIVTGPGSDEDEFQKLADFDGIYYLKKPFFIEEFIKAITQVSEEARQKAKIKT